ncbi:MAG: hypothetical protein QM760_20200 [Nibricoccus sp.]
MPASTTVNSVLRNAQKIAEVWNANATFTLNDITQKSFGDLQAEAAQLSETVESRRIELQGLINKRDDIVGELQLAITRARSGIRAFFGPDSSEYDQAGGKRQSERKSSARRGTSKSATPSK